MKFLLPGLAAGLLASAAFAAPPTFSANRMAKDVQVLSSNTFEGRGTASAAEPQVIGYIVGQLSAAGVQPGGDPGPKGRLWTEAVPLARYQITGPIRAGFTAGGQEIGLTQGQEIAIRAAETGTSRVAIASAPVVFVGYGVKAPERNWDDFKGYDLKGKIAIVLVNDPDFETGSGDFGGKAMTYYGRWTYKFEEAARQGAAGFIVVHETAPAAYGWATVRNSNTGPVFDIVRPDPARTHAPLEAWMTREATVDLFRRAGLDFDALKAQARSRDFHPTLLPGVSFSADYAVDVQRVVSHNIVGVLLGRGHPDERVIYSAHWDHLGVGKPDARGDAIYNGAIDNGTGVAALLELARAFAAAPRTDRTVEFLSVTAEEQGLLGSEYYAAQPLYPLATTVADLNMDVMAVDGAARDLGVRGQGGLTLQDDLATVARDHGRAFTPEPDPEAGHFYRSDHFSLAKRGVPAISFTPGQDLVVGGTAAGKAAYDAYYRQRYHQPSDEYDPSWTFAAMVDDLGVLYDLGRRLATSRAWPSWYAGSEFKTARDVSAEARK